MRKAVLILALGWSGLCYGQGSLYSGVAQTATGQALAGVSAVICNGTDPTGTATPCSGIAPTYTDVTLGTQCTAFPSVTAVEGPASGTGCTYPGLTDGYGNFTFYAAAGSFWLEIYGYGISTPYIKQIIFPFVQSQSTSAFVNPGIFTNTQMNEYVTSVINNCNSSTEEQLTAGTSNFSSNAISGCIIAPITSAVVNANAVAGYSKSLSTTTSAVGGNFQGHSAVSNGFTAFGVDAWAFDDVGVTNTPLTALEADLQTNNADASYVAVNGLNIVGNFKGGQIGNPPTNYKAKAAQCVAIGTGNWNVCFWVPDGAANTALFMGAQCSTGTCSGSVIRSHGMTSSVESQEVTFGSDATGNPLLTSGAGTVGLRTSPKVFANLPTCVSGLEGSMSPITDSSTVTWGATITGGSTNHVMGYCDGTNWTVMAK